MFAIVSTILLAQASTAPANLTDFDRFCSKLDNASAMEARLEGAGWHRFETDGSTEIGRLVAAIDQLPSPAYKISTHVFRTKDGPVILVSQMTAPDGGGSIECKHIDEGATLPTTAALQVWAGTKPEFEKIDGAAMWMWKPGRGDAQFTAVVYVAPTTKHRWPGVGVITTSVRIY